MSKEQDIERHQAAAHAMQTGVAVEQAHKPESPKHLRVGVNTALVDHAALVALLIQKGVLTEDEYLSAIADGMEEEARRYEEHLTSLMGARVTLR